MTPRPTKATFSQQCVRGSNGPPLSLTLAWIFLFSFFFLTFFLLFILINLGCFRAFFHLKFALLKIFYFASDHVSLDFWNYIFAGLVYVFSLFRKANFYRQFGRMRMVLWLEHLKNFNWNNNKKMFWRVWFKNLETWCLWKFKIFQ